MDADWRKSLEETVRQRRLVIFQFDGEEWRCLQESRRGLNEFTIARSHEYLRQIRIPTACILIMQDDFETEVRFGIVSSRSAISTLESRIKIKKSQRIQPSSKAELFWLIEDKLSPGKQDELASNKPVVVLPPKPSAHLVGKLAEIETNHGPMRLVAASLSFPKRFHSAAEMQQDAVQSALRTFGLSADVQAASLHLVKGQDTTLDRVDVLREDTVIEHDARSVPGYDLVGSDLTGCAVFKNDTEKLEVYTANRGHLEEVFGVDLIYMNMTRRNIVMVQYKMLESQRRNTDDVDWIYRPDKNLETEIKRMQTFRKSHAPGQFEYRLNPEVFYLKFVKRDGAMKNASITMPIDHFERLREDPSCQGPRGGFRISFESLAGRYLRQTAFLDLIRSGYIGSHAKTTKDLKTLVEAVVQQGRTAVAAIQSQRI